MVREEAVAVRGWGRCGDGAGNRIRSQRSAGKEPQAIPTGDPFDSAYGLPQGRLFSLGS